MLFEPLSLRGDEAIRAIHDVGLLIPVGKTVDGSTEFKIPLLYRSGLGVTDRRQKSKPPHDHASSEHTNIIEVKRMNASN